MFNRGVGLLHAFEYSRALDAFRLVAHSDVDCAIANFGTALAEWGLWRAHGTPAALERGRRALAGAEVMRQASVRERRYLEAAAVLFRDGGLDLWTTQRAYADAMRSLARAYPDDTDARALAALALLDQPERDLRRAFENRRDARSMLSAGRRTVDHPGVTHYTILAADDAATAARAFDAASASLASAESAYALHVPSHVFAKRGLWTEAIDANLRAADAARRDGEPAEELHALEALVYFYLQLGNDHEAGAIAVRVPVLGAMLAVGGVRGQAAREAVVAVPARVALERGAWQQAAALPLPATGPDWALQITRLARALGAARFGDARAARLELEAVGVVDPSGAADDRGPIAAADARGLRLIAEAWSDVAEGRSERALETLRTEAAREAEMGSASVSLGLLVPAHENLAELLLQLGRTAEALTAFQASLTVAPHRLRSIIGAADAAQRVGLRDVAKGYAGRLADIASAADRPLRPALEAYARQKR